MSDAVKIFLFLVTLSIPFIAVALKYLFYIAALWLLHEGLHVICKARIGAVKMKYWIGFSKSDDERFFLGLVFTENINVAKKHFFNSIPIFETWCEVGETHECHLYSLFHIRRLKELDNMENYFTNDADDNHYRSTDGFNKADCYKLARLGLMQLNDDWKIETIIDLATFPFYPSKHLQQNPKRLKKHLRYKALLERGLVDDMGMPFYRKKATTVAIKRT